LEVIMTAHARGSFVAVALLLAGSAVAHHSPTVFDQTREIELEGVVTDFHWGNPHSWILMDVTDADNRVENWSIEMNPPTYLVRGGWRSNTIKPGDHVKVVAHPLRTDEPGGQYVAITLPDGTVLGEQQAVLGEEEAPDE
jgi:hypothetical protein